MYSNKERAELNLWRFKQHTVILYCGFSLINSGGCKLEDKGQSHATDTDKCLLSLERPCISLLKVGFDVPRKDMQDDMVSKFRVSQTKLVLDFLDGVSRNITEFSCPSDTCTTL